MPVVLSIDTNKLVEKGTHIHEILPGFWSYLEHHEDSLSQLVAATPHLPDCINLSILIMWVVSQDRIQHTNSTVRSISAAVGVLRVSKWLALNAYLVKLIAVESVASFRELK